MEHAGATSGMEHAGATSGMEHAGATSGTDPLLDGLDPVQRQAVASEAQPLCILAGAGSGKTRVLTRRIALRVRSGTALPQHVLALTFTRRAAAELSSRLGALGIRDQVAAGTFHSMASAQLRRLWADRGERAPALLERRARVIVPVLSGGRRAVPAAEVAAEIEWAKARMVDPDGYEAAAVAAGRRPPLSTAEMASVFRRYEEEKRRRGLVDFDDLLLLCATAIDTDARFAATQRWRFRHLFVDEFQDVNPLQFRLLEAWRGGRPDLCVVGDPDQAIYAWNGADAGYLSDFPRRFPGAEVINLDHNYRSTPQVLAVANAALGRPRLTATRPDGPLPAIVAYASDRDEAGHVARSLRRSAAIRPWSDLAVLTRTHAQLVVFEEALRAAGVPFRTRGVVPFLDRPDVRAILSELARRPSIPLAATLPDLRQLLDEASAGDEVAATLENLDRLARELLAADPAATVGSFGGWLRATLGGDHLPAGDDAVELATFHAAKGLEWPVVFLAGLEQGLVPIAHADTPADRAEERRLLYVAVTRARQDVHLSWAERRTFGARTLPRSPSPWLAALEAAVRDLAEGGSGADWRRFLDEGRAHLDAAPRFRRPGGRADPEVLQALRSWRASTARASGVPAFVVLHDTTLAAVAEAAPHDRSALLALPGFGPVKADRYGEALLAVVASCAR
ncbi:MAG: ATP-dependent DNA helicase UvrD2 [Actinomycetota bacterium]|nr:ATP-dependent DNA helicase UvrD2 [Actinomycetota bacterium]